MKKLMLVLVLVGMVVVGSSVMANAAVFTFDQAELLKFWDVFENPSNVDSNTIGTWKTAMGGNIVEFSPQISDAAGNTYSPFAQMGIGVNFWGSSADGGSGNATVSDVGASSLVGYDYYGLTFRNIDQSKWSVNLFMNTGYTDGGYGEPNNYYEATWTQIIPGQTATLLLDLSGAANLNHVTSIGFNLGSDMKGKIGHPQYDPTYPSFKDTAYMQVLPVPEPMSLSLLGLGLLGAIGAGFRRKK